jgi:hypothetical protein
MEHMKKSLPEQYESETGERAVGHNQSMYKVMLEKRKLLEKQRKEAEKRNVEWRLKMERENRSWTGY